MYVELDNIQEGSVDAGLFEMPEDYTEVKVKGAGTARKKSGQASDSASFGITKKEYTVKRKRGLAGRGIMLDPRKKSLVRVTDIAQDGKDTKGRIDISTRVAKHEQGGIMYEQKKLGQIDLMLKNGESRAWKFPAAAAVSHFDIMLTQGGGVRLMSMQPERAGTTPAELEAEWSDAKQFFQSSPDAPAQKTDTGQGNSSDAATASKDTTQVDKPKGNVSTSRERQKEPESTEHSQAATPSAQGKNSSRAANIMFILDASGSMWGEVEGRDKIAIAKEVMAGLIRDLPDNTRAGLVAYGHRRKGDCQDVEELVPIAPLDKESLIQTIQGLSPKGKTPITRSVRITAEKLKALEDETTIILVSDGKESCGGDPCAMVKELKKTGLRFVMHVIGFDVTREGREQLECMAKAGGGRYFTAKTAGEFEAAAQEVVKETKTVGFLQVMAFRNDKPVPARVEVLDQETGELAHTAKTSLNKDKPAVLRLKPGTYKVIFTDEELPGNPSRSFSDVGIELDQSVSKTARFQAGNLELSAIKEGKSINAHARVYRGDNQITSGWLEEGKGSTFKLLPGKYRLVVTDKSVPQNPEVVLNDVEVQPGQSVSKKAEFPREGQLKIEAFQEGKSLHVYVRVYKEDGQVTYGWLEEGKGKTFKLLPGSYRVEVKGPDNQVKEQKGISIQSGQTTNVDIQF